MNLQELTDAELQQLLGAVQKEKAVRYEEWRRERLATLLANRNVEVVESEESDVQADFDAPDIPPVTN